MPYYDSIGQIIKKGDNVKFRGKVYTISKFKDGQGRFKTAQIIFKEKRSPQIGQDEIGVDLINSCVR
jgi:hypothetical protein